MPRNGKQKCSIPCGSKNVSLLNSLQPRSEAHPATYPIGTVGKWLWRKCNLHLVPASTLSGAVLLFLPKIFYFLELIVALRNKVVFQYKHQIIKA
jgi:hypothetical protein